MIAKEQPEWKNTLQMAEKTPWNIPFPAPQLLPEVGIKAERDKSGAGAQVGCACPRLRGGKGVPKMMLMAPDIPHPKSFPRGMGGDMDMAWGCWRAPGGAGRFFCLFYSWLSRGVGFLLENHRKDRKEQPGAVSEEDK